jgi:hypothetical protein
MINAGALRPEMTHGSVRRAPFRRLERGFLGAHRGGVRAFRGVRDRARSQEAAATTAVVRSCPSPGNEDHSFHQDREPSEFDSFSVGFDAENDGRATRCCGDPGMGVVGAVPPVVGPHSVDAPGSTSGSSAAPVTSRTTANIGQDRFRGSVLRDARDPRRFSSGSCKLNRS